MMLAAQPRTAGYRPEQNQTTTDTGSTCLSVEQRSYAKECMYTGQFIYIGKRTRDERWTTRLWTSNFTRRLRRYQRKGRKTASSTPNSAFLLQPQPRPLPNKKRSELTDSNSRQGKSVQECAMQFLPWHGCTIARDGAAACQLRCTDAFVCGSRPESHSRIGGRCSFHEHGTDGGRDNA